MALRDIINTIISEAEREADDIRKKGNDELKLTQKQWQEKVEAEKKKINAQIKKEAQKVVDRAKFQTNIEKRNQIVSAKQAVVDEVFSKSLEKMAGLEDEEYVGFVKKLIKKLPEMESGEILPVKGKEGLTEKALKESGRNFSISSETASGAGGFIFKSKDIEVNNTFGSLLSGIRGDLEIEVSRLLFGTK